MFLIEILKEYFAFDSAYTKESSSSLFIDEDINICGYWDDDDDDFDDD